MANNSAHRIQPTRLCRDGHEDRPRLTRSSRRRRHSHHPHLFPRLCPWVLRRPGPRPGSGSGPACRRKPRFYRVPTAPAPQAVTLWLRASFKSFAKIPKTFRGLALGSRLGWGTRLGRQEAGGGPAREAQCREGGEGGPGQSSLG